MSRACRRRARRTSAWCRRTARRRCRAREHSQIEFQIVPDLEDAGSSSSGFSAASACLSGICSARARRRTDPRRRRCCDARAGRSRPRRRDARARSRTASPASDRGWWFRCRSPPADVARARDPGFEPVEVAHDLVSRAVDLRATLRPAHAARPASGLCVAPSVPRALADSGRRRPAAIAGRRLARRRGRGAAAAWPVRGFSGRPAASASARSRPRRSVRISATRRVSVENSIALRKAISFL